MHTENLDAIVESIAQNYRTSPEIFFTDPDRHFPNKKNVEGILKSLRRVMFPSYFGDEAPTGAKPEYFIGEMLLRIEDSLRRELREAFLFRAGKGDEMNQIAPIAYEDVDTRVEEVCTAFMNRLPEVHRILLTDV